MWGPGAARTLAGKLSRRPCFAGLSCLFARSAASAEKSRAGGTTGFRLNLDPGDVGEVAPGRRPGPQRSRPPVPADPRAEGSAALCQGRSRVPSSA